MDFDQMMTNINRNYDILEKKLERLIKQRNELKAININLIKNSRNSQKVYFY
jgi:hypothetical protein